MAVNNFLLLIPRGNISGVEIQATLEELYEDELEVTEHPVEIGAQISDHSFNRPCQLRLRCGWSNSGINSAVSTVLALLSGSYATADDYVTSVYTRLLALKQARNPITIVASLRTYPNMVITGLSVTRDAKSSQALMLTASLKEIIIVSTQAVNPLPIANQAVPANTAGIVNNGSGAVTFALPANTGALDPSKWIPFGTTSAGP